MRRTWLTALTALALALGVVVLAGCAGKGGDAPQEGTPEPQYKVVCTTFPAYDWTMQVLRDQSNRFEVTYLLGNGVDLHSYQPSVADMAAVSDADLFIYVGGESDAWAADAVEGAKNPDLRSLSLLEAIGNAAVEEQTAEKDAKKADGAQGEVEYDEHVWLSLRNAQTLTDAIATQLASIDPDHAKTYHGNAQAYRDRLTQLDGSYREVVEDASHKALVFADRFPFVYLTNDYGIEHFEAFSGCSAETEASFETVTSLAKKVDSLGLRSVLVIDGSDKKIAKTVIQNTKDKSQKILVLDSLQSTKNKDIESGKTYLGTMESNLKVLKDALA